MFCGRDWPRTVSVDGLKSPPKARVLRLPHGDQDSARGTVPQPSFPEERHWNAERQAVEFWVEIGE
jgi:hypothetical protein